MTFLQRVRMLFWRTPALLEEIERETKEKENAKLREAELWATRWAVEQHRAEQHRQALARNGLTVHSAGAVPTEAAVQQMLGRSSRAAAQTVLPPSGLSPRASRTLAVMQRDAVTRAARRQRPEPTLEDTLVAVGAAVEVASFVEALRDDFSSNDNSESNDTSSSDVFSGNGEDFGGGGSSGEF